MTTADEADKKARVERARETGLFRYSLVQELLEPGLSQAERGWRARELAGRAHQGPGGRRVTVSYATLTRWRRRYEEGGFDALVPSPRQPAPRTPEEVLALAEALKREKPGRTAAQVRRVLQVTSGWAPSDRTLQRLFERLELNRPAPGPQEEQRALGRFECTRPNEMWTGDTLHGPVIGGKKSYLFAFVQFTDRRLLDRLLTWALTSRTCSPRPNQKISEKEAGAWRAPQVRFLWSQADVADIAGPGG